MDKKYTFLDRICLGIDDALRALSDNSKSTNAPYPGAKAPDVMNATQRKHSAGLMRVNHAGEVCAQALYQGQALVSKDRMLQEKLRHAAVEEGNHLRWCSRRLAELNSHTSYLNPVWYVGSFGIGMVAGLVGDRWSLGFIAETEQQVIRHLNQHLTLLPKQDERSYKILQQMQSEEAGHREEAIKAGAQELPTFIKKAMQLASKVMVKTAYWI